MLQYRSQCRGTYGHTVQPRVKVKDSDAAEAMPAQHRKWCSNQVQQCYRITNEHTVQPRAEAKYDKYSTVQGASAEAKCSRHSTAKSVEAKVQ